MTRERRVELDGTLLRVDERRLDTVHGEFRAHVFRNLATREIAVALARGAVATPGPLLCRVHSSCVTSEAFGACDCDCAEQLDAALEAIAKEGRGVLFYLMQEGRGAGLTAKARDRMLVQASRERLSTFEAYDRLGLARDQRRYDEVAAMCRMLSIEAPLELLTNNPDKVTLLEREKLQVSAARPLQRASSPFNRHYLQAKQRSGHVLEGLEGEGSRASWPDTVSWFEPTALPGRPAIVYSASYWLPVSAGPTDGSAWFRLHLYCDLSDWGNRSERVVLTYGSPSRDDPFLLRVQPEHLLDRFPLQAPYARLGWNRTIRAFVEHGAGGVVFVPPRLAVGQRIGRVAEIGEVRQVSPLESAESGESAESVERVDSVSLGLLAEHAKGRSCRLVCDRVSSDLDLAAAAGLATVGVKLGPPVRLGA